MTRSRRLQIGASLVIAMGIFALFAPEKAEARQLLPCEDPIYVADCNDIPAWFREFCMLCEERIAACHDDISHLAFCEYEQ